MPGDIEPLVSAIVLPNPSSEGIRYPHKFRVQKDRMSQAVLPAQIVVQLPATAARIYHTLPRGVVVNRRPAVGTETSG